jgi:hypothetical protein
VSNAVLFGVGNVSVVLARGDRAVSPAATFRRSPILRSRLPERDGASKEDETASRSLSAAGAAALALYVAVQLVLPLRPLLYAGRSAWTDEGATFAWRMMLRDKRGSAYFLVRDHARGTVRRVNPRTVRHGLAAPHADRYPRHAAPVRPLARAARSERACE